MKALKDKGFKAHALTDHGSLAGALPFYQAMRDEGLQPLLGAEFYFADQPTVKDEANRGSAHLILIAKNEEGWRNLLRLSKLSWSDGFYYKPRIGLDWITAHGAGLICLTACLGGVLAREVWREKDGKATLGLVKRWQQLRAIFGDDLYVEFQGHDAAEQREVHQHYVERLGGEEGFQHVITNDCHYIAPEHAKVQALVKTAAYGKSEAAQSYTTFDSLWLKTPKEVVDGFSRFHGDLSRRFVVDGMLATEEIVEKCKAFELPKKRYLPRFSEKEDSVALFQKLTTTALAAFMQRPGILDFATRDEYVARFKKEFRVIVQYGLADYFLIVWDIIRWAGEKGIYVGIGRGSSAGSLIAYLLGIVKLNPLQYKLLFERFLNANRCESGELPDIDMDFESERRDEVKRYVFERYGSDRVCEIGTYGRMMLKTAILDFGKQFGFDTRDLMQITTTLGLDKNEAQNLDAAMENSPRLKSIMRKHPDFESSVRAINGQIKNQSIHPAGVLICSEPLELVTPLKSQKRTGETERSIVTQAEDKHVIAQGLVKIDLLGLKEYDIFKYVVEHSGGALTHDTYFDTIHEAGLKVRDEAVWKMFRTGKTDAVFQFSSDGMRQLLVDMKADCLADIIAAVALYRPGCLENGWHTRYYRRKHGDEDVVFAHESLSETLADTYGVCVYQEQFMETFHKLGGVSLVDADTIRSALGKKDAEKLKKFRAEFVAGAGPKMGSEKDAEEVWDQLAKAAGYTFNRSHSAVYGLVAYVSQWMKVHYPLPFWAAVLDWDLRKKKWDEMLTNKRAAAAMGVVPAMPDINRSKGRFTVDGGRVLWSFTGIRGIGEKTADEIVANQPFASFEDFYKRVHKGRVKQNNIEALIYAGAFDSLGDRCDMLAWLWSQKKKGKAMTARPKLTPDHLLKEHYRVIGFFERRLREVFDGFATGSLFDERDVCDTMAGEPVLVGGMVADVKAFKTRKGDAMGRATIVDLDERIELTFFPTTWSRYRSLLKEGNLLQVAGRKSDYGGRQNQVEVEEVEGIGLPPPSDSRPPWDEDD